MARPGTLGWPLGPARGGIAASRRGNAGLERQRHVGDGNEPSRQAFRADLRRSRKRSARAAEPAGRLRRHVHAGRRFRENAIVPMNLMGRRGTPAADFVVTGHWSKRSHAEAGRYGSAHIAASSAQATQLDGREQAPFTWVPATDTWQVRKESAYLHLCSNETIGGVEFLDWPDTAALGAPDVPLVVDASSHFLSRPLDVARCGMVYAGAQKNAGPAGVTMVIARRDLIGHACRSARRPSTMPMSPQSTRATTRRPPSRSTSPGWCSSGSRPTAAWPAWKPPTRPRPTCCTATWTAPASTAIRSTRPCARA